MPELKTETHSTSAPARFEDRQKEVDARFAEQKQMLEEACKSSAEIFTDVKVVQGSLRDLGVVTHQVGQAVKEVHGVVLGIDEKVDILLDDACAPKNPWALMGWRFSKTVEKYARIASPVLSVVAVGTVVAAGTIKLVNVVKATKARKVAAAEKAQADWEAEMASISSADLK